ncbi:otogelin isoform X3 [Oryzias latipes]
MLSVLRMDRRFGRIGPFRCCVTAWLILVSHAHLCCSADRENLSDWRSSGSSRRKQEKWDTTSQGGQTAFVLPDINTTAPSQSLVGWIPVSNLTSSTDERTENASWTDSSDSSTVTNIPTSTASQKLHSTTKNSTSQIRASSARTTPSKKPQTNPVTFPDQHHKKSLVSATQTKLGRPAMVSTPSSSRAVQYTQSKTSPVLHTQKGTTTASKTAQEPGQSPTTKKQAHDKKGQSIVETTNHSQTNKTSISRSPNKTMLQSPQPPITTWQTEPLQSSNTATTTETPVQLSSTVASLSQVNGVIRHLSVPNSTPPASQVHGRMTQASPFPDPDPSTQTEMANQQSKGSASHTSLTAKTVHQSQVNLSPVTTKPADTSQDIILPPVGSVTETKPLNQSLDAKKSDSQSPKSSEAPEKLSGSSSTEKPARNSAIRTPQTTQSLPNTAQSGQSPISRESFDQFQSITAAPYTSTAKSRQGLFDRNLLQTSLKTSALRPSGLADEPIHTPQPSGPNAPSMTATNQSPSTSGTIDRSQNSSTQSTPALEPTANRAFPPEQPPANVSVLTKQTKEALGSSRRRISGESCDFPCLNGGQCVQQSCDCSLYHATGLRCQTVVNLGFEREMTCRTWGQYNFETFDGLYYYFPGRCSYTLLKDCGETTQGGLVVQVHNDPECSSAPYTCQRSVSIFLPWEGEIRLHASNVTFKGRRLQLPHHLHHLQLEQISQYVLVTQQQGFTLAWEGRTGSVYIKLSPDFVGGTCGLCGNFNAEVQDDMTTSYGLLTHDVEMFGNSWMEMDPHQNTCPPVGSSFPSPCNALDVQVLMRVEEVCSMLLSPPFQSCHDFVSPLPYMASCSNDLCRSGPSGDVVCQVLSEYARACAHADHPLLDWRRDIPQCVPPCPAGLQYRECISCCPATCSLERTCIDSRLACLDGCYCPDGLIFQDGGCVEASDCPCEHHGVFYPAGQMLQEECNNCTCVGGVWNCTDHSCPGECSVTGDMFFQSFDGRIFTFPASCQYVLVKSRLSGKFTVTIQNAPCGPDLDGACIQSVSLVVDEDPRTEMTLSHMGEVFMAGQYRISLPYYDDVFHIQELSSMFLQVRTAFGLQLQYSWAEFRLYLQAEERWKDDTVGLCGTFNGNIQDDFLSPSGMIESTPQLFGNSWKVSSACSSSLSVSPIDPCDSHQQAVSYASSMCDVLNQDLFAACHDYLSPAPFHQQCRANTCRCGTPCLCSTLAHYARHCRKFSVIVDFRSHIPDCAVSCPATMEYSSCVSSCQRRCSSLAALQRCGEECEEGCACPQGSFYNHRTHTCVHRSQCPCSLFGADYEPGDVMVTSAGVRLCLNGKLVSQSPDSERLCPAGQLYQNCSDGDDAFLPGRGVACERTCESHLLNIPCSSHDSCVSGCVCPHGLLKHGDECFEPAACPCLWKGKEYFPGDRVSSPCYQCACQDGTFQCAFRPCPSMCTAYGDRHYRTFDGLLFDYVGACKVYLVKSSADAVFSVTAENVDCFDTGVICKKYLLINVGASLLSLDDHMGKPNPSSVIDRNQRLFIWQAGLFTVVHFPEEDITVLWDHKTTVHVQVGPHWQGRLSGLCGNFDLKTVNEMRTPENMDSPTPQEFGNSWTATECVNSPDIRHPCSLNPLREPYAKHQCAVLLSEVFQTCHPVVDVSWFYENCLADTCACSRGGDCECFCSSVAAYAQRCCHEGVPVDWRSPSLCPHDCEFYNKVLGKGPIQLLTLRDPTAVVAASRSGGLVFLQQANTSAPAAAAAVFSQFMMTPGLSKARRHDSSRVSFEAAERPNYFLHASQTGQMRLAKWENSERFWTGATFIIRRNTWIPGFDSFESQAKAGFFLHAKPSRVHLLKYKATESFRRATLFRLAGPGPDSQPGPRCQWRYDACVRPCFRTCSDPSAEACTGIPQVEGCLPFCPPHMVLDEVTHRCVYMEDCFEIPAGHVPTTPPAAAFSARTSPGTSTSTSSMKTTIYTTKPSSQPDTVTTSKAYGPFSTKESPLSPIRHPTAVEPLSSVVVTEHLSATSSNTTTIRSPSTTVSPFTPSRTMTTATTSTTTTAVPFRTSVGGLTMSSISTEVYTEDNITETTVGAYQVGKSSTPVLATVSELSIHKATVPGTDVTVDTGTSTKSTTVKELPTTPPAILPGVPSEASTTSGSVSPLAERKTIFMPTLPSEEKIQSVTPVIPFNTNKTTQQTLPTDLYLVNFTTTTIPKLLPTNSTHIKPASMAASSITTNLKTTREVTITELPESKISGVSTKAASPLSRITHTTYPASSVFWHGAARVTDKTPTSGVTSRPLVVPESFNMSTNLFTTQSTTISVSPTETTATPLSETTESSTSPVTTDQTAKPWHPPHRETSFTTVYKPTVKAPSEVSSESVVTSTTVPQPPVTPTTILTSSTGRTTQTTTSETPTAERGATTTRKLVTTQPMPGTIKSPQTTASTTLLPPTVVSTTLRPVVAQRITEVSHAETGRLQFTTKDTTPPPPPVYPLSTRISDVAKSPTTIQDTVITLLVSTPKSEPTTIPDTTKQTTTSRTTASVPVATKVTSNITSTGRSTIRPTTASFITRTKPSGETTTSTTVGPSTVVPSHSPAITSRVSPAAVVNATTHSSTTDLHLTTIVASDPNNVPGPSSTSTPIVTTSELTSSGRVSPAKEASVSLSKVLTPTLISEISGSNTTLAPSDPTDKTTAALGVTSPSIVVPSAPAGATSYKPEDTTPLTVPPSRMCTPPYVEIVDECTKYICVKNQLVLFNKSQSCPFSAEPPNCGLLGFAVLVNGDKCCPKWDCPCRCSMFPDLNVITFDGNSVAIYKAALYIVTQLPNETVTVMVQECPADSESLLLWNFTNLCLVSLNITHQSNHVLINRLQRRLYVNTRYAKARFKKYGFEIYDTGNMYLIRSPAGLKLQWYHSTGMMVIETDSKVPTMGLCGVCDGDPTDDLTLPNGSVLGAGEDPALFIDSWQVSNTTSYISQSRRRDLNCSTSDCSTCLSMLENATFTACHAFVPPSTFCEVWVRDSEYVNNQCVALAAYVASCHKFNICIEWRRPNYCPFICAATLRYQACLPACTSQSCPNHDFDADPEQCSGLTEGCVCPEGTLLHRQYSALCIPPEKCACTDSAGVPRANGEVWKASRDGCCMYRCDNDTILPVQDDCSRLPQPVCQRAGEMIISMAHESSCCPHKVCLCNQSLCDQVPPICKYGEKLVSYHREDSCCPDYVCECDAGLCVANIPTCREDQTLVATRADGSCCVAHICMCSSCLLTAPVCQDGEVIAVNNATTDRCCPVYQCVCEPYRCPQLSCPLGMSVVAMSTPNRCCPKQTCECACEKIPFPNCRLGETAQLDQAFLFDLQNPCSCKRYRCVREEVCVFGDRSVLQPGQTLLEHRDGGLCITRQCSHARDPASGFYLLQTSSVNCSAHCQANQIYVPPKDQSTCCGVCKNISCLYQHENGTTSLYKPGRSWASNCMKFDCSDTQFGPTLITYAFSCPPFNETECMKIGGTVVNYMDGCCKTCTGFHLFPFPVSTVTPTVNTNCERGKEDGKSCQKVTVRMTIRKNDCRSNRPVNIVSCDGKCPSASIYNYNINTYARFCKCCRETGLQRRSVQLYCSSNATWVTYSIQEPTDCSCQWS